MGFYKFHQYPYNWTPKLLPHIPHDTDSAALPAPKSLPFFGLRTSGVFDSGECARWAFGSFGLVSERRRLLCKAFSFIQESSVDKGVTEIFHRKPIARARWCKYSISRPGAVVDSQKPRRQIVFGNWFFILCHKQFVLKNGERVRVKFTIWVERLSATMWISFLGRWLATTSPRKATNCWLAWGATD
jgi:hypothetical protein